MSVLNKESLLSHLVTSLKNKAGSTGSNGFVIMEDGSFLTEVLIKLVEKTELGVKFIPVKDKKEQIFEAIEVASQNKLLILGNLTKERYSLLRDFDKRYDMNVDIQPLATLYTSEVNELGEFLNIQITESNDKSTAENYIRLIEKFTGSGQGEAFLGVAGALKDTVLYNDNVYNDLLNLGKTELSTRHLVNSNVIILNVRDHGLGLVK